MIGEYVRLGLVVELTEDNVEPIDGGLVIDTPPGTSEIRVERTFIRDRLGAWGADHAFVFEEGRVVADTEEVTFTTFRPNATPSYTLGSRDSVALTERPMWLSVETGDEGTVTVTADAEDTSGQPIRVDASWLWDQGVYTPRVVHEDGFNVPVEWVEGGAAYQADVPHFSEVRWEMSGVDISAELDVKIRIDGVLSDHTGDEVWDKENRTLKIEVGDYLTDIDVLVERKWTDNHISNLAVWQHAVTNETIDGTEFYVSSLEAAETPTLHVLREYQASNLTMFTRGDIDGSIWSPVWRFIKVQQKDANLTLHTWPASGSNISTYPIFLNDTYLQDQNLPSPRPVNQSGHALDLGASTNETFFLVDATGENPANVTISNSSLPTVSADEGVCDDTMTHLPVDESPPTWNHDNLVAGSYANVYVGEGAFCWEWHLDTYKINWGDLSHFQVWGYAKDPNSGEILCEIRVPAGDPVKMQDASKECEPDEPIPNQVIVYFGAHAMREEDENTDGTSYARKSMMMKTSDWQDRNCQVIPMAVAFEPAMAAGQLAFYAVCISLSAPWLEQTVHDVFTDWLESEDENGNGEKKVKVWHERIITNTSIRTDVPEAEIYVNVIDSNNNRDDTWDILEDLPVNLLASPTGPQSIQWQVKDVSGAELEYDSNYSHIKEISAETRDNNNYRVTDWNPGQTYLEADAKVSNFNQPRLELQTVDWEAPEPLFEELEIGNCHQLSSNITVVVLEMDSMAAPNETWIQMNVTDFNGLDAGNVSDGGSISAQDVDAWNSTAKAIANATVQNTTFVQEACVLGITSYDYESPMEAASSGSSTIRDRLIRGSDEELVTIEFYYAPAGS